MRPVKFSVDPLRSFLRKQRIATLPQLKHALGTKADITVFRKLRELSYHTSYSHRGRYYTLAEVADFDERGLWMFDAVWFSRWGTLLHTAESFVNQSPAGYFAAELEELLHVPVKEPLLQLVRQGKLSRQEVSHLYLYCASGRDQRHQQLRARQARRKHPGVAGSIAHREVSDQVRAAIILFWSLLDEQQRRLYAGLESLKLGSGGDHQMADFLQLDPHTVAKGRRQLLAQEVTVDRVRKLGAGRKPVEKKRPR